MKTLLTCTVNGEERAVLADTPIRSAIWRGVSSPSPSRPG